MIAARQVNGLFRRLSSADLKVPPGVHHGVRLKVTEKEAHQVARSVVDCSSGCFIYLFVWCQMARFGNRLFGVRCWCHVTHNLNLFSLIVIGGFVKGFGWVKGKDYVSRLFCLVDAVLAVRFGFGACSTFVYVVQLLDQL